MTPPSRRITVLQLCPHTLHTLRLPFCVHLPPRTVAASHRACVCNYTRTRLGFPTTTTLPLLPTHLSLHSPKFYTRHVTFARFAVIYLFCLVWFTLPFWYSSAYLFSPPLLLAIPFRALDRWTRSHLRPPLLPPTLPTLPPPRCSPHVDCWLVHYILIGGLVVGGCVG